MRKSVLVSIENVIFLFWLLAYITWMLDREHNSSEVFQTGGMGDAAFLNTIMF